MEQLKAAELQDYFKDDCVSALQQKIQTLEAIDHKTAAIYPILLADRTEILLSLPNEIKRFTIATNWENVTNEVRQFRRKLENRTTREYLPHAQQLYQWLIAPLQTTLNAHKIDTLIMVPDESLRTIPMAALHDGNVFLIEKYAIANTPSLNLTDPKTTFHRERTSTCYRTGQSRSRVSSLTPRYFRTKQYPKNVWWGNLTR